MKKLIVACIAIVAALVLWANVAVRAEGIVPGPWGSWRAAPCCRDYGAPGFRGRPPLAFTHGVLGPAMVGGGYLPPPGMPLGPYDRFPPDQVPTQGPALETLPAPPYEPVEPAEPPPPAGGPPPPPIGWIFGRYMTCQGPGCFVSTDLDGLNVRQTPAGLPVVALANGTPVLPFRNAGPWVLVAVLCNLQPTNGWSVNSNVPLMAC